MKKIFYNLFLLIFFILIFFITLLSTKGIETNRFNNLISKKINYTNNNLNLELSTVKFKLDLKEVSLFLETEEPKIDYRNMIIPAKNIKVYIDFTSLIKSDPNIKKIILIVNQLDIEQLKKISISLKPSNLTSFVNNKIKEGKLNTELEIYLDNNNLFTNFIARGTVSNLKTELISNIDLNKINFSFFADKTDVLIKDISGETGPIKIKEGDLKLKLSSDISIEANFISNIKYNNKITNYKNLIKNLQYAKNIVSLEANLNNSILINLDKTYKVKKYEYKNNGKIEKINFDFEKSLKNDFLGKKVEQLHLTKSEIKTNFNSKNNTTFFSGKYSLNGGNSLLFNIDNMIEGNSLKLKLDAEYDEPIDI